MHNNRGAPMALNGEVEDPSMMLYRGFLYLIHPESLTERRSVSFFGTCKAEVA